MRKIYFVLIFFFTLNAIKAQQSLNMELLAHWNNTTLPIVDGDQLWSDIMGYYDSTNKKEYAILLGNDSLYFFDITIPSQTKLVAVKDGYSTKSINRDVEVYNHYAYFVAERSGKLGGLQILDLNYLPDSVHEVYRSDELSVQAHTVFIEAKSKRLYICQNSLKLGFSAMDVFSLNNPEKPTKMASLEVPTNTQGNAQFNKVHEMYSRNDTVYLSCYESGLFIMDLTDLNNQKLLGTITNYPERGTNHSSWLNNKGDIIMFTDENLGSPIKLFDLKDIANPRQISSFNSHTNALPHNAYWKDNMAITSSYEDGVYVFDLTNPISPKIHAYYDTYLLNANNVFSGFHGCWGVWPFLPSGNIIASDISEGLFVLKVKYGLGINNTETMVNNIQIYPNPAQKNIYFKLPLNLEKTSIDILNLQGKLVLNTILNNETNMLNIEQLNAGFYLCRISCNGIQKTIKFIVE